MFPKGAAAEDSMTTAYDGQGSAHQKNRREQRFAFCSGLGFTVGYSGGIVPAGAGVERRSEALTAVRLPLLLEAKDQVFLAYC